MKRRQAKKIVVGWLRRKPLRRGGSCGGGVLRPIAKQGFPPALLRALQVLGNVSFRFLGG